MPLSADIKKCTTFVFVEDGTGQLVPNGTAFFVGVKARGENEGGHYIHLVTAKHVLKDANGAWLKNIYIRLNKHDGTSGIEKIDLSRVGMMIHTDDTVDLAAFILVPKDEIYDWLFIGEDLWATKQVMKDRDIAEGDDVMFAGLFTSHVGQVRNQPIFRFGKVALLSEEKVDWKEEGKPAEMLDLYLLECQSFGGNSGSPVFFHLSPTRLPGTVTFGGTNVYLAGVMRGSFLSRNLVTKLNASEQLLSMENLGIAAVTPAFLLHEMLTEASKRKQI